MSIGAKIINDSRSYIIDGDYVNPRMVRKGSITTAQDPPRGQNPDRTNKIRVPLAPGEILAFSCSSAPAGFSGYDGTNAILSAGNSANQESHLIEYWIFDQRDTQPEKYGMQIFSESGVKVFDSAWKIMRFSGVLRSGSVTLKNGRKYAVIPQQVHMKMVRTQSNFNPSPVFPNVVSRASTGDGVLVNGNVLTIQQVTLSVWMAALFYGVAGWNASYDNNIPTSYLIVDVTDY